MKNIIFISSILLIFSCKAQQQTFPLKTYAESVPVGSYFKDLNNELDFYTGTWTAIFQDKSITLKIVKQLKEPVKFFNKNYYRDQLFVRYEVKKNGVILESTLDKSFTNDSKLSVKSAYPDENGNKVTLLFSGGNCSVGIGTIVFKKINSTQFYWGYYPGTTTRIDTLCPPNNDYTIYLPETENLVFTKQ
ncbi:DUF6705 family protein [Chryseobacterium gallinarum]|uniref:DUF6705 domain-containing protein n=1 Tax=Chryseobacterium gallinarum TaxID=1324352 RepID=A0ABX6KWR4_CHRGL|nr:DUF6705 family protein [Chryseobacterium gallinarum]QIY92483.1 hypothetical protein FOB44_18300 [Chryseobacterium gallinarum]